MTFSLPVVAIADLTSPAELFRCAHFHNAILSAGACIARQNLRKKAHGAAKDQSDKVPHHLEHCASGKCEQGNAVKLKLAGYVPPTGDHAERVEKWRAQGPARLKKIEQQIAAKVASGELRARDAGAELIQRLPRAPDVSLPELGEEEDTVADKVCKEQGCVATLRANNESGYCKPHGRKHAQRRARARRAGKPVPVQPAAPVVYDGLTALRPTDSIETLLEQRRAHHLAEAERCGLALKALRGAA